MTNENDNLVCIGEAQNSIEAGLIKAFLNDNGIFCYIQGENHRSQLGVMGPFIELNVHVRSEQAQEASVLLNQIYAQRTQSPIEQSTSAEPEVVDAHSPKKKRIGVAILLTFCVTFGTAHLYVGAKWRFFCLACLECVGFFIAFGHQDRGDAIGFAVVGCAIVLDFVGALAIIFRRKKQV